MGVTTLRHGFCPRCAPAEEARLEAMRQRTDDARPSASDRGYDLKWRRVRAQFLKAHPTCTCGDPATEVDHMLPLRLGGTHRWENLRPLCKRCHSSRTARDHGFGRIRA